MAVYKDKKTGKWYFRVYVTDPITNKRFQVQRNGYELKRDAAEEEARMVASYENKEVRLSALMFDDLLDEYLVFQKKRVKITTYTGYVYLIDSHITPFFKNVKINDITRVLLERWYNYINELEHTVSHKNKILARLKSILEYCEDQYGIRVRYLNTFPPFKSNPKTKRKKVIYDEELFKKFINHTENELEKTLFYTMFYTGARIGEVRALTWNDINLDKNYININKQVTNKITGQGPTIIKPKTDSSCRNIQIPNILVEQLRAWHKTRKLITGYNQNWQVFGDIGFITENRIRRMVERIAKAAQTPYITLHEFRHSYTSLLYSKNIDPKIMQAQVGHSSVNVTMDIYTHIEEEKAKKTIINMFDEEKS